MQSKAQAKAQAKAGALPYEAGKGRSLRLRGRTASV